METVNLTPAGLQTPEGQARCNKAVEAVGKIDQQCMDKLRDLYRVLGDGGLISALMKDGSTREDAVAEADEISSLLETRDWLSNEIAAALCGRAQYDIEDTVKPYLAMAGFFPREEKKKE